MGTDKLLEFKGEDKTYPDDAWVAAPVKSDDGSLVLIHGQVMQHRKYILNTLILKTNLQVYHKTERNTRDKPRPAYTFHIIETERGLALRQQELAPAHSCNCPLGSFLSSVNKNI